MTGYEKFIATKTKIIQPCGFEANGSLGGYLFDFQKAIVKWSLRLGRSAIFADCGLGKTIMQLEWAKHIPGKVLILTPLAVAEQTVKEGAKFGIPVKYARSGKDLEGITVTNYEMLEHFNPDDFTGIVLDESSIIKHKDAKTRDQVIQSFGKTQYRLACTATPAPNDFMELGNHAEFLGVMTLTEMLSMYFVHDGGETQKWRLKGHAETEFWKWVCSWAVLIKKPSDIGFDDAKFKLPPLEFQEHHVKSEVATDGYLFALPAATLQERIQARRGSTEDRVAKLAELVNASKEKWIVWCNLNVESEAMTKAVDGAVEVKGSDSLQEKEKALTDFSNGKIRVLVTKPSIAGFGMNWQHCHNVAFLGLSDSYEQFYQAIRRCWRFGQKKEVQCHIVIADTEGAVLANIKRKERDAEKMRDNMIEHMAAEMKKAIVGGEAQSIPYKSDVKKGDNWILYMGDSCEVLRKITTDSIHYSIFSPPFSSLYTYSNSPRDLGNSTTHEQFIEHFEYIVEQLYRVIMPGRLLSFHCMNLPTSKQNHGYIGIRDFRGELIKLFQKSGFIYHSEVCIWKDPVTAMQRTKALGLLHKQIKKDSCMSRQGIPDYLVTMRKPGENPERVGHTNETFPVDLWQKYASPVWMDINPSDTIQFRSAREHKDERHICPLQLQVISRALELWTNPGDVVLSPFAGIGSEGYEAVRLGRKYLGVELKESYWKQAVANIQLLEKSKKENELGLD